MAQQIINYGNTANDGTGDPLRDAFIKVDENFNQIWAAGPVGSNVTILNNTIAVTNTNGNLILTPNGIGVIQTNSKILPRLDNTYDLGNSSLRYRSLSIGAGGIALTGNLTIATVDELRIPGGLNGYILQTDGNSNLSWVAYPGAGNGSPGGANTQVQFNDNGLFGGTVDFTFNKNNGVATLNTLSAANVFTDSFAVNRDADPWIIRGNSIRAPSGARWASDPTTLDDYISSAVDGYLNISTFDINSNLATQLHMEHGLVHINILDGVNYTWEFLDDGSFTSPGNVSGNYIIGNGSLLTNLPGGVIQGNVPPPSPNASTLWWDDVTGRLYVWYDDGSGLQWVDAAPAGPPSSYGNANVSLYMASGNNTAGISTTGNVAGNYFVGNGSLLTGVTASANTGNIGFVGDAIYDLNGIYLENADLSHGATASVILPVNGDANSVQINNTYGNIILQVGSSSTITGSWTLNNSGTVQSPIISADALPPATTPGLRAFVNDANLVAASNFGQIVGNAGSNVVPVYSDGSNWRIG